MRKVKFMMIFVLLVLGLSACKSKENKSKNGEKTNIKTEENNKKKESEKDKEKIEVKEEAPLEQYSDENYASLVIFGVGDLSSGNVSCEGLNAILILEANKETQEINIASVCKTTLFKGTNGEFSSINGVYSNEKENGTMDALNMNLDLKIRKFLTFDFISLAEIVDSVGGIEITITEAESSEMNKYIDKISQYVGKESQVVCAGENTLDGVQSVAYSYIRQNVGAEFARVERQRLVLRCVFEKMKDLNDADIIECAKTIVPQIETNYKVSELYKIMQKVRMYKIMDEMTYPQEYAVKTIADIGNVIIPTDLNENVKRLNEFLRPNETHNNSALINELDKEIEQIVGK